MKIHFAILTLSLMVALATSTFAVPKNVIIIRHADRVIPNGVCLSLQGLERAAALAYYFSETPRYNTPPITHIFAAYSNQPPQPYVRCKQTCEPTANHLKLPVDLDFNRYQVAEVAKEILTNPKYDNATILMCWEHKHIAPLVVALGGKEPDFLPENIFDQVYMLSFEKDNKPKFQQFLQELLFGDRATFKDEPHPLPQVLVPCPVAS
ncbi:MAG TPA: histidine phosphatase family protein [Alphaproteobacteria bacterium]|nr:histidine phosphatase family protein [Alphaproteobacteria bacterium]